ncbi:hypothetical protein YC2023_037554 [Brassica napus]
MPADHQKFRGLGHETLSARYWVQTGCLDLDHEDQSFFRSGADFGRFMGSLLGSLLKYNALEDFQEVFQKTSTLPEDFLEVWKSSDGMTYTEFVRPTTYMEVVHDKQGLTRISE